MSNQPPDEVPEDEVETPGEEEEPETEIERMSRLRRIGNELFNRPPDEEQR